MDCLKRSWEKLCLIICFFTPKEKKGSISGILIASKSVVFVHILLLNKGMCAQNGKRTLAEGSVLRFCAAM